MWALEHRLQWAVILLSGLTDFCEQTGSQQEQRTNNTTTNNSSGIRGGMSADSAETRTTARPREGRYNPEWDLRSGTSHCSRDKFILKYKVKTGKSWFQCEVKVSKIPSHVLSPFVKILSSYRVCSHQIQIGLHLFQISGRLGSDLIFRSVSARVALCSFH